VQRSEFYRAVIEKVEMLRFNTLLTVTDNILLVRDGIFESPGLLNASYSQNVSPGRLALKLDKTFRALIQIDYK